MAATEERVQTGTFCSTSGTYFMDKDSLAAHYKSDFHRYNLKRKLAGLPPVTKEWFEARREQLAAGQAAAGASLPLGSTKIWVDPLTRKKFKTESTYQAYIRSKKYTELLRKDGLDSPPQPTVMVVQQREEPPKGTTAPEPGAFKESAGFKVVEPSGGLPKKTEDDKVMKEKEEDAEGSDWETASDESEVAELPTETEKELQEEDGGSLPVEDWNLQRSLFDNHMSPSFEANLEYMFKNFGFYLPDAEYLKDPEGLMRYLGAKLQCGRIPLYTAGDDPSARQFRSLHAVQRHMVDSVRCKMLYDDNEEEYEEFYDYSTTNADGGDEQEQGKQLVVGEANTAAHVAGYELVVGDGGGNGPGKVLGSREFARYYRQRPRPDDERLSVVINTMLANYRKLGIATKDMVDPEEKKARVHASRRFDRSRMHVFMNNNVIRNLPKNVPY